MADRQSTLRLARVTYREAPRLMGMMRLSSYLLARVFLRKMGAELTPAPGDKSGAVYLVKWGN